MFHVISAAWTASHGKFAARQAGPNEYAAWHGWKVRQASGAEPGNTVTRGSPSSPPRVRTHVRRRRWHVPGRTPRRRPGSAPWPRHRCAEPLQEGDCVLIPRPTRVTTAITPSPRRPDAAQVHLTAGWDLWRSAPMLA